MAIKDLPHFTIGSDQLAQWLRNQSEKSWWTVDGDPYLTERINFPCPGLEIADVLRTAKMRLIFLDACEAKDATGQKIDANQLEQHVAKDDGGYRVLRLAWENLPNSDWLLIEDTDIPRQSLALDEGTQ